MFAVKRIGSFIFMIHKQQFTLHNHNHVYVNYNIVMNINIHICLLSNYTA